VEKGSAERLGIEPHSGADLRHADRMDDEVLAGLADLIGVMHAGIDERLFDLVAVDNSRSVRRMLFDDREQVVQEPKLAGIELDAFDRRVGLGMLDPVDGLPRGSDHRRQAATAVAGAAPSPAVLGSRGAGFARCAIGSRLLARPDGALDTLAAAGASA
jgi:hypothetical protein